MVSDAVEQRAGEALAGEHRRPFLEAEPVNDFETVTITIY